ncbi:MAG TPA: VOC family protein [Anaerolineaceae bacterium]|nr:VOC family protein [Anaerolineaceae bacterium]
MQTKLTPYLNFRDNTREVMTFYQTVFGGKLTFSTFKEFGVSQDPAEENKIMHSMLEVENGMTLMAADVPNSMDLKPGTNISITLSGDNDEELTRYYNMLSAGGNVLEPLAKAPWGDSFGMFVDKFGISWMVNISVVAD